MSRFRLERLLRLREREADLEKAAWATKVREAKDAETSRDGAQQAVEDGRATAMALHQSGHSPHVVAALTLSAYERIDALSEQMELANDALRVAVDAAEAARAPFEERRQNVEALKRLETRWNDERRTARRRKEDRASEAVIATRAIAANREATRNQVSDTNAPDTSE